MIFSKVIKELIKIFPFDVEETTKTIEIAKYKERLEWLFKKYAEADNPMKECILFGQIIIIAEIINEIGCYERCREIDRQKIKPAK